MCRIKHKTGIPVKSLWLLARNKRRALAREIKERDE